MADPISVKDSDSRLNFHNFNQASCLFALIFHSGQVRPDNNNSEKCAKLIIKRTFLLEQFKKHCNPNVKNLTYQQLTYVIMDAVCQEKSVKLIYSDRLFRAFRSYIWRLLGDYRKAKSSGGRNVKAFLQKLSEKPPWIVTVKSDEFVDVEEFERCCREWKKYEAQIKAEKEAKKALQEGKLSSLLPASR